MKKCQGTHKKDEKGLVTWIQKAFSPFLRNACVFFILSSTPRMSYIQFFLPFLFSWYSLALIHMPDADRWINNQIKKEEKEDIKSWKSAKALTKRVKKPLTNKRSQIFFTLFPFCHLFISSFIFHFSSFYVISSRRLIITQHALRAWYRSRLRREIYQKCVSKII